MPTVFHKPFKPVSEERFKNWISIFDRDDSRLHITPAQYRWKAQHIPSTTEGKVNFVEGIQTMGGAGGPALKVRLALVVVLNLLNRMVWRYICMHAIVIWRKKRFTHLMEIFLLSHSRELFWSKLSLEG
jgi:hypothetical protein